MFLQGVEHKNMSNSVTNCAQHSSPGETMMAERNYISTYDIKYIIISLDMFRFCLIRKKNSPVDSLALIIASTSVTNVFRVQSSVAQQPRLCTSWLLNSDFNFTCTRRRHTQVTSIYYYIGMYYVCAYTESLLR